MIKQKNLNRWLWKWHVIGGLISLPFLFLLATTGAIYLKRILMIPFMTKLNGLRLCLVGLFALTLSNLQR